MTRRSEGGTRFVSMRVAVRRTGLDEEVVQECVRREVVGEPLSEGDLMELRRIRRLRELGVNMPGIEIILHMRRRLEALQAQVGRQQQRGPRPSGEQWIVIEDRRWQRLLPPQPDR